MTFEEHDALPSSEEGQTKYIDCNVKYGDKECPKCPYPAHQTFEAVGFFGMETAPNG